MSTQTKRTVLVTGATGTQGGAVARALMSGGHRVRAFTRKPDGAAARALVAAGAEVAAGDFGDAAALDRALAGVDAVFAMSTPFEAGPDAEASQGRALVAAARRANVEHFVYTSVGSADKKTGIPHFESKARVEQAVRDSGLPFTILGPVFFMENLRAPWMASGLHRGVMAMALPAGRTLQQVAVADIGRFGALVLDRRDPFVGKRIDLASDEATGTRTAEVLSRALGRKIEYVEVPLAQVRATSEDSALMFEWFDKVGYSADIAGLRRQYPEVGWHTLDAWAAKQDWSSYANER